jgi:Cysteine rich repeat
MRNSSRPLLLAGFIVALASNTIAAQEPTQAERDAIRSACRSDFMAHCASVQPGGKEALECLLKNDSQLSPSCKSAVSAVVRKPEPAAQEPAASTSAPAGDAAKARSTQTQDEQIKAIRQACTLDDFMAHCSWIQPSSPEVVLCLKANAAGLSPSCRAAIASRSDTPPPSLPADIGRKEQTTPEPRKPEPARMQARWFRLKQACFANQLASRKTQSERLAALTSYHTAPRFSQAEPKQCVASSAMPDSFRRRVRPLSPPSLEARPRRHPRCLPRMQRPLRLRHSHPCLHCVPGRRWRSCGFAARKCGCCAVTFRLEAAA